jgi:hypothetical protein
MWRRNARRAESDDLAPIARSQQRSLLEASIDALVIIELGRGAVHVSAIGQRPLRCAFTDAMLHVAYAAPAHPARSARDERPMNLDAAFRQRQSVFGSSRSTRILL